MAVVTISRVIGSVGDEIALKVAESLGYVLVDNALIVKVAERAGVSVEDAASFDEKYKSKVVEWLKNFIEPRVGKILTEEGKHLDPDMFVEYCKTVILGLAEEGNVVIVGRAGQFILKDRDNAFHVRINADMNFRIERLKVLHNIGEKHALDMIKKSDNMRKHYIERCFKSDWNDPLVYHLMLESSKLGIDMTASIISEGVKEFSRTREYIPGVKDRRSGQERRKDDKRKGDRRYAELGWSAKDISHAVMRDGRPSRSHAKTDRRKMLRRKTIRRTSDKKTDEK